jgi:glycosyltransferase involved in cell wall biosynthesis
VKVVVSVGGRFHAVKLAEQLERTGHLERIITTKSWYVRGLPRRRRVAIPLPEYLGMLVRAVPALRQRGWYSYVKDNLFDALSRRYIPPCDVFHAWGNYALIAMPTARRLGAAVVIERGSTHPHYQDEILREEFARFGVVSERAHPQIIEKGLREIELADRVIIPSAFVRRTFIDRGVPESRLALVPYGIDLDHFRRADRRDNVFRVLFVGNIGVQKGVHYLLDAWKRLAFPGAELRLVGTVEPGFGAVLARYEGLFALGGHVRHEDLWREYGDASVFVLPSLQEGSAMVSYEAMACGIPSIVSENTGSVLRDGIDGFVIPIRSVEAIMDRLTWVREHADEARAMGGSAADHVRGFTWERYARGVREVYRAVLAAREGGA